MESGHLPAAALEVAPPLLERGALVETQRQMVRSLDESIEKTRDRNGVRPFHVSSHFTIPAAVILAVLLVAFGFLPTVRPDVLERNAMLRLFTTFFLHGLRVNGGPPKPLPMVSDMAKVVHAGLTEEIVNAFHLTLLMPGPPFYVSAYLGAKAWGVPGAIVEWPAF